MQIKTKYGMAEGVYDGDEEHVLFAGIPYARPPVDNLRWKPPQPPEPWEGVRRCDAYGPAAVQRVIPVGPGRWMCYGQEYFPAEQDRFSEDCLYLNIWVRTEALRQKKRLPVLVIIHGGGYTTGAGHVPVLNGRNFSDEDVVVVTFNYRIGIFGFLAHPALSAENERHVSGNYGFLDQIAALKWVRENIAAFGGNPDCVTIAGESAGGGSVSVLYQSPLAKGLFHRAFAQSAALFTGTSLDGGRTASLAWHEQVNRAEFEKLGITTAKQMRAMDVRELCRIPGAWGPVYDGYVLDGNYRSIFCGRRQNDVSLMVGSNSDEGLIFADPGMEKEEFCREIEERYGEHARDIKAVYLKEGAKMPQAVFDERRDRMFEQHTYVWARLQSEYGTAPVWLYYFDRKIPDVGYGAFHSSALEFFYRNLDCSDVRWQETDRRLSETMAAYLKNFIYYGNPVQGEDREWKTAAEAPEEVMRFGERTGMAPMPHPEAVRTLTKAFGLDDIIAFREKPDLKTGNNKKKG